MPRYEVVESKRWEGPNGRKVSPHGACPWATDAERSLWSLVTVGWTVRDTRTGTIGVGRVPWKDRAEAQAFADRANKEG